MIQVESISGTFTRERALQGLYPIRVLIIKDGSGWLCMNSGDYKLLKGRIFFIPEEGLVRLEADIESGYWLTFSDLLYKDFLLQHLDPMAKNLFINLSYKDLDNDSTKIYSIINHLEKDIDAQKDLPFLSQDISLLLGYACGLEGYLEASSLDELQQIIRFKAILEQYYKQEKAIKFYAEGMGISPKSLNSFLKRALGKSFFGLVKDRVMREAKELLLHSNYSIDEIANILGFENTLSFTKAFKRHKGVSAYQLSLLG